MESSKVHSSTTPQTEDITSAEQSFGSLSEMSNIDSSSAFQSQSDVSLTGDEPLTAEGVPKVVQETWDEDSSQLQLEKSTSIIEYAAKVEVIIPAEDKPQELSSDLALSFIQDQSQKELQVQPEEENVVELTEEIEKFELDPNIPALFENIAQPHSDGKMEEEVLNVKFTGVRDFEYTPECIIFDLLRVSLFHGWLVDPQEHEVVSAIGNNLFILPIYF